MLKEVIMTFGGETCLRVMFCKKRQFHTLLAKFSIEGNLLNDIDVEKTFAEKYSLVQVFYVNTYGILSHSG